MKIFMLGSLSSSNAKHHMQRLLSRCCYWLACITVKEYIATHLGASDVGSPRSICSIARWRQAWRIHYVTTQVVSGSRESCKSKFWLAVNSLSTEGRRRVLVCRQCVAACQPGATLRQVHQLSVRSLCDGLAQLRVFPGLSPDTLAGGAYQTVYPHSVGARQLHASPLAARCVHVSVAPWPSGSLLASYAFFEPVLLRFKARHTAARVLQAGFSALSVLHYCCHLCLPRNLPADVQALSVFRTLVGMHPCNQLCRPLAGAGYARYSSHWLRPPVAPGRRADRGARSVPAT